MTALKTLDPEADGLEGAKDLAKADLMYSCCGAKESSSALLLDLGLS